MNLLVIIWFDKHIMTIVTFPQELKDFTYISTFSGHPTWLYNYKTALDELAPVKEVNFISSKDISIPGFY